MKAKLHDKGALEIIEEAVHFLRLSPKALLFKYYIGSLPFVIAFLFFWGDLSRKAIADQYLIEASLGLAILFIWMKSWQSVFVGEIKAMKGNLEIPKWSFIRVVRLFVTQTIFQCSGFILLPLALVITIPFAWVFAFYQNILAGEYKDKLSLKTVLNDAITGAKLWPMQNHCLILIFFLFGLFVFLNIAVCIYLVPYLLKMLLGIETLFSRSGLTVLNSTFLFSAMAMNYLCLDPLIKTVYALRSFYGASSQSGADLKAELNRFTLSAISSVIPIFIILGTISLNTCFAEEKAGVTFLQFPTENSEISPAELDRTIQEILNNREFNWRMPREKAKQDEEGFKPFKAFIDWIKPHVKKWVDTVEKWMDNFFDWLDKILPTFEKSEEKKDNSWMKSLRWFLFALFLILVVVLIVFFIQVWKKSKKEPVEVTKTQKKTPDLNDEEITADDLPTDRWLTLAKELIEKGSLRLGLRALYLATLSLLSSHHFITIAKHKSNREYQKELGRHSHDNPGIFDIFSENSLVFDQIWYGMYDVTMPDIEQFIKNHDRISAIAH